MAESRTRPTKLSVAAFIDAITDETRRGEAKAIVKLMQKAAGEKATMWGLSIIGFGSLHYLYESGREGDTPLIGFSPRKAAIVFYNLTGFSGSEALLAKLGKYTTGKACLYIKRLTDVDQAVLEALAVRSVAALRVGAVESHSTNPAREQAGVGIVGIRWIGESLAFPPPPCR